MKKNISMFFLLILSFPSMSYEFHSALYYPELEMIERSIEDLEFRVSVNEMEIAELKEIINDIDTFRKHDKRFDMLELFIKRRVKDEVSSIVLKAVLLGSAAYITWWLWNR